MQHITLTSRTFANRALRSLSFIMAAVLLGNVALPAAVLAAEAANRPITDGSTTVSATEVARTLKGVPGILDASDGVQVRTDADSALITNAAGVSIDVPKNIDQGVTFGTVHGPKLRVELPNAANAGNSKQIAMGVVGYSSSDGSANAVQANEDGSVRMLTVIDNPNAPTQYDYKVNVPNGGTEGIRETGGAEVKDKAGEVISFVGAPWAKDATGKAISTWFTTDGQTLTQHVQHNTPGVVYPVTADPAWFAIAAGVVAWAASACVGNAISSLGLDGLRWALQRGDWYWNKKLEDALWNCAWGAATGGAMKFAPQPVKLWLANEIRNVARNLLRWRI